MEQNTITGTILTLWMVSAFVMTMYDKQGIKFKSDAEKAEAAYKEIAEEYEKIQDKTNPFSDAMKACDAVMAKYK